MTEFPCALLVEDNDGDAFLLKQYLGGSITIERAGTLEEASAVMKRVRVDVILLDLRLPGSTGIDTLRRILPESLFIPVIVLTGLDDHKLVLEALRTGARDYFVKNRLNANDLLEAIYKHTHWSREIRSKMAMDFAF